MNKCQLSICARVIVAAVWGIVRHLYIIREKAALCKAQTV